MQVNDIPMMICAQCKKPIEAENGYFTSWIAWQRMDFHVPCRPQINFSKERREDTIPKAKKIG